MGARSVLALPGPMALMFWPVVVAYRTLTSCFDSAMKTYPGQVFTRYVGNVSSLLAKCVVVWLVATILLISSAVLYFTFHYSMMPTMLVTMPVHFQFTPCYSQPEVCTYPRGQVYLVDSSGTPFLHPHVPYTISLEMDMPESDSNKEAAGMFMVQMNLTSVSGRLVGASSRANILHYRSRLHRTLRTLFLSPLLLTEYQHEQQRVTTELFTAYLVHEEEPPTSARLELRSHSVQLYGARLRAHARLSGLRRLMYHHPVVSGVLGTAATFCSLACVFVLLWLRTTDLPRKLSQLRRPRPGTATALRASSADAAIPDSTSSPLAEKSLDDCKAPASDGDVAEEVETVPGQRGWSSGLLPQRLADSGWLFGQRAQKQD